MKREILFRAKRIDNGEWVEGDLHVIDCKHPHIHCNGISYRIDVNTIGQFTGLTDKNGVKIFEGYILKFDDGENWETGRLVVEFINGAFNFCCFHPEQKEFIDEPRIIEVIGNIHDNPELL